MKHGPMILLSCTASMPQTMAALITPTRFTKLAVAPRCSVAPRCQHGAYETQQSYSAQIVWSFEAYFGVRGFAVSSEDERIVDSYYSDDQHMLDLNNQLRQHVINQQVKEMAADVSAMGGSAGSIYKQDYRFLPYTLRNGEEQVLSRWNMQKQKLTVSRVQCKVRVADDGTALLTSCGKGPTVWRSWGGLWNYLNKDEWRILQNGDQVGLDCQDPEAAVFTCLAETSAAALQQGYVAQPGYSQQGLPANWVIGIDQESGANYYYNEQTGQSQWEPPQQGGY